MPPSTAELRESLQTLLANGPSSESPMIELKRHSFVYSSTYPLEEVFVTFKNGFELEILFKDLSYQSLPEAAKLAKPSFLYRPLREIETYRVLLANHSLGTAKFYGAVVDEQQQRFWLFLERVRGEELYKIGDFSVWENVARRLAVMHDTWAHQAVQASLPSTHYLIQTADYYGNWMHRALQFVDGSSNSRAKDARGSIHRLADRYETVVRRLTALPTTIIHGEFYPSNILIAQTAGELRICPIDWETTAVGPGLIDLAALLSGRWSEGQRMALAKAYFESLTPASVSAYSSQAAFFQAIDDGRLHLAVQWLGWSRNWTPPDAHAHDWLSETLQLAARVGCL